MPKSKHSIHYTDEMVQFLRVNYPLHFAPELTKMFNKKFHKAQSVEKIRSFLKSRGIKAGGNRTKRLYTDEHLAWIKEAYQELNLPRLTEAFNEKFKGMNVSVSSIRACVKNNKITCGRTGHFEKGQESWNKGMKGLQLGGEAGWFKPGKIPINHRPVGSERVNVYGYIEIKVAEPRTWDLKHRVVWCEHNGEIGPDELIQFRDNNKLNCSIENLFKSTCAINASMNKSGYNQLKGELKDTAVCLTKLKLETSKAEQDRIA